MKSEEQIYMIAMFLRPGKHLLFINNVLFTEIIEPRNEEIPHFERVVKKKVNIN